MSRNGQPVYSCFFQQSSFATFALTPAKDVVKIRRDAPIDMLGPLGCGLQTGAGAVLNVMQPQGQSIAGRSIAIYGVGGVGLAGLMAAKVAGCDPIIAVDRLPARLALARELGATYALESKGAETLAEIRKITGGGTHLALETSAIPAVFRLAVDGLRGLGTCVLVGSARGGTEVSFEMPWLQGGRTVRGVIQGDSKPREFIPRLVDLFMAGQMPIDRLVTRYELADINRAAADATSGATIKPVLRLPH
jgi:aryl-alcohol dehydrogenase